MVDRSNQGGAAVVVKKKGTRERYDVQFGAGLVVGIFLAGAFNPVDKGLYLSVLYRRPFLLRENFQHPFEGFGQAILQRTLSAGLYYPLYDTWQPLMDRVLPSYQHTVLPSIVAGILAGASSGALLNALSVVKYHNWGSSQYSKFNVVKQAYVMYMNGGLIFFWNGIHATVFRDAVFGAT